MSRRAAAPAAAKEGVGTGDRRNEGWPEQQDSLVDSLCRPCVIILTAGDIADCTVSLIAGITKLVGDKAYDSDSFRKSPQQEGSHL